MSISCNPKPPGQPRAPAYHRYEVYYMYYVYYLDANPMTECQVRTRSLAQLRVWIRDGSGSQSQEPSACLKIYCTHKSRIKWRRGRFVMKTRTET